MASGTETKTQVVKKVFNRSFEIRYNNEQSHSVTLLVSVSVSSSHGLSEMISGPVVVF